MNALNKTKNVRKALERCRGEWADSLCYGCPYDDKIGCRDALYKDTLEVIDGFKDVLKKRTIRSSAAKPIFITLSSFTNGEKDEKIAIKVDDIFLISDASNSFGRGSIISMKTIDGADRLTLCVKDTLEDILEKISNEETE